MIIAHFLFNFSELRPLHSLTELRIRPRGSYGASSTDIGQNLCESLRLGMPFENVETNTHAHFVTPALLPLMTRNDIKFFYVYLIVLNLPSVRAQSISSFPQTD
jgi:hypothetical protein